MQCSAVQLGAAVVVLRAKSKNLLTRLCTARGAYAANLLSLEGHD